MAKAAYVGINDIARKVNNIYVGVNGVARKVVKGYVGVNGIARQFWGEEESDSGTITHDPDQYITGYITQPVYYILNQIEYTYYSRRSVPVDDRSVYCTLRCFAENYSNSVYFIYLAQVQAGTQSDTHYGRCIAISKTPFSYVVRKISGNDPNNYDTYQSAIQETMSNGDTFYYYAYGGYNLRQCDFPIGTTIVSSLCDLVNLTSGYNQAALRELAYITLTGEKHKP